MAGSFAQSRSATEHQNKVIDGAFSILGSKVESHNKCAKQLHNLFNTEITNYLNRDSLGSALGEDAGMARVALGQARYDKIRFNIGRGEHTSAVNRELVYSGRAREITAEEVMDDDELEESDHDEDITGQNETTGKEKDNTGQKEDETKTG